MINVFSSRRWKRFKLAVKDTFARPHPRPIFILGHQKSGTTAIAALLAEMLGEQYSHDLFVSRGISNIDDLYAGRVSADSLLRAAPSAFAAGVIKEPDLTLIYESLRKKFPQADFVFVVRDPRSTIRSILNRLGIPGNVDRLSLAQEQQISRRPIWREILNPRWIEDKSQHHVEVLAHRWCKFAAIYLGHPDGMQLLRYEDFDSDKVSSLSQLAGRLQRTPRRDISHLVDHQFQPRGQRGVSFDEFFGAENVSRIEKICASKMEEFGYPLSERLVQQ
jgi:hypothetical protein